MECEILYVDEPRLLGFGWNTYSICTAFVVVNVMILVVVMQ